MSAIAGVFGRDGLPINRTTLERMSPGLQDMGPDDERFACIRSVGMLYRPFYTQHDERLSLQPLVTDDGYMLSFDGRLDNARDVKRGLSQHVTQEARPAEAVLAVYRRWGLDGFARLVGDFALALWDPRDHRLYLCCDGLGRRPLYYHVSADYVLWCSRSRPLLEALRKVPELEEEFIADFLTNQPTTQSPFKGIALVPGGHALVADRQATQLKRFWSSHPQRQISYRSDEEYEAHFSEVFREAVASRLQAEGSVFCELSGGVDSSSIACVANGLAGSIDGSSSGIRTVSFVFEQAPTADERAHIRLVEEQLGRQGLHISEVMCPILTPLPDSLTPDHPTNQLSFLARQNFLARHMRELGSRVLLSGIGGDHAFWSTPPPGLALVDPLVQGRLVTLLRSCSEWSKLLRQPFLTTLWLGAWLLLPPRWKAISQRDEPLSDWFDRAFAKRTRLRERMFRPPVDWALPRLSASIHHGLVCQAARLYALEWCSSEGYVDVRYPYLDRRLIEFALAIPLEQTVRLAETRSIVRRALRRVLPEAIRQRRSKAGPDEAFYRAIITQWHWLSTLLPDLRVSAYGFVNRSAFVSALDRARHGVVANSVQLIRTMSLELWLRTLEGWTSIMRDGAVCATRGRRHAKEAYVTTA